MTLRELQANVRKLAHAVMDGSLSGLFVVGPGGLGKTHAVLEAFAEAELEPRTPNTHATAFGLYSELYALRSERVVLLEDLEQLYTSLPSLSLLRSLLWGPRRSDGSMKRTVTWTTAAIEQGGLPPSFEFKAGIIMTANRFPTRNDIFRSLRTRVPVVRFDVEPPEVFAFMRELTADGFTVYDGRQGIGARISREECERVIALLEKNAATDLRMLSHALTLYHRHRDEAHQWQSLLSTILSPDPEFVAPASGTDTRRRSPLELEIVRELSDRDDLPARDKVRVYMEETGKSRASFFRHQRQIRGRGMGNGSSG